VFSKYLSACDSLSEYLSGDFPDIFSVTALLENFEGLLQIFAEVAGLALQCDVHMPLWINECLESRRILDEWEGRLGAHVIFGAIPETRLEYEDDELSAHNDVSALQWLFRRI